MPQKFGNGNISHPMVPPVEVYLYPSWCGNHSAHRTGRRLKHATCNCRDSANSLASYQSSCELPSSLTNISKECGYDTCILQGSIKNSFCESWEQRKQTSPHQTIPSYTYPIPSSLTRYKHRVYQASPSLAKATAAECELPSTATRFFDIKASLSWSCRPTNFGYNDFDM